MVMAHVVGVMPLTGEVGLSSLLSSAGTAILDILEDGSSTYLFMSLSFSLPL